MVIGVLDTRKQELLFVLLMGRDDDGLVGSKQTLIQGIDQAIGRHPELPGLEDEGPGAALGSTIGLEGVVERALGSVEGKGYGSTGLVDDAVEVLKASRFRKDLGGEDFGRRGLGGRHF